MTAHDTIDEVDGIPVEKGELKRGRNAAQQVVTREYNDAIALWRKMQAEVGEKLAKCVQVNGSPEMMMLANQFMNLHPPVRGITTRAQVIAKIRQLREDKAAGRKRPGGRGHGGGQRKHGVESLADKASGRAGKSSRAGKPNRAGKLSRPASSPVRRSPRHAQAFGAFDGVDFFGDDVAGSSGLDGDSGTIDDF